MLRREGRVDVKFMLSRREDCDESELDDLRLRAENEDVAVTVEGDLGFEEEFAGICA